MIILLLLPVVAYTGFCGYRMYELSEQREELKSDYASLNNIKYGLLSVDRWRDHITGIVHKQIDEFELSNQQEDTLKREINKVLNALIAQSVEMINEKQKNVGGKLKKAAFNAFIDVDKIRERVPEFSQTILDQLKQPRSLRKLKFLATDKMNEFAKQTRDSLEGLAYDKLLIKYAVTNSDDFNRITLSKADALEKQIYRYALIFIGVTLLFLLIWFLIRKQAFLYTPMFTLSVLLALAMLGTGLATPMIEIDARIQEINFFLIGENIKFYDQVLFYQSKSILNVVVILIKTGKADSVFVGLLILIFSVIFPVAKLLSTKINLLGSRKWKNSTLIRFFAFRSGKWSMADVMVVAIFMAFIGFKGILDSEVVHLNKEMNNQYVASIATNKTSLEPGFILFLSFVLFGLILSVILKKISPKPEKEISTTDISATVPVNGILSKPQLQS